jgi:HK97 family phage major capsid protein
MFVYKTDAQLEAMSAAERDTYATEKRAHEAELLKKAITEGNKALKYELTEAQKAEITSQVDALKSSLGITKEQLDEFKEDIRIIKENPAAVNGKGEFDLFKAIEEGLKTFLPQVKAKSEASGRNGFEIEMTVKSPVNMNTGSVTTGYSVPVSYVAQDQTTYAEDVRQQEYILNYISRGNTGKATIAYVDKSPTEGTMTITNEGALKPLISISFIIRYSQARKMAGRTKISEEALDDIPFIMSAIRNELAYEHAIGVQTDVFTTVSAFAPAFVAGSLAASTISPTNYDAIRAAIFAVKIASKGLYVPNAVLVPSSDLYTMGATKDKNNNYVFPPFVMPDGTTISGVRIVEVADGVSVPAGTFIVADWKKLRMENYKSFTVRIGQGIVGSATAANIVSDFESNMYTLIGESRYHLWVYENEKVAFLKTTFAAVKTAIELIVP